MRGRSWSKSLGLAGAILVAAACSDTSDDPSDRPIVVEDGGPLPVEERVIDDSASAVGGAEPTDPPAEIVLVPEPEAPDASRRARPDPESRPSEPDSTPEVEPADARPVARGDDPRAAEPAEAIPDATGPLVVPAETRIEAELRTPFHSATTRIGDRFAARTLESVEIDGRTAVESNALVEGRVVRVESAEGAEGRGLVELDLISFVLPNGERIPLDADVAAIEPRKVVAGRARSKAEGAVVGAGAGGAAGAILGGSRKATAIGAILGGVAGAVIVSGEPDHELVVPSGTVLVITLGAPLEIPASR